MWRPPGAPAVPWLTRDDQVLATVDLSKRLRRRSVPAGSVVVVAQARLVQLLVLPPSLDTAWCQYPVGETAEPGVHLLVVRGIGRRSVLRSAAPHRPGAILIAPGASFDRWRLQVGDRLEVKVLHGVGG